MVTCFLPAIILIFCFRYSDGLFFHIAETERKCFIEEIPDETTVLGNNQRSMYASYKLVIETILALMFLILVNYKVELYDPRTNGFMPSQPGIGMHVEVKDPDEKVIMSRVSVKIQQPIFLYFISFLSSISFVGVQC